jgi:hypothetical protein
VHELPAFPRIGNSVLSMGLLGFGGGGGMKGGERKGAHRATFLLAYSNYWGNSEVLGEISPNRSG